jgi:23S rRNA pseudouridine2605 synthase
MIDCRISPLRSIECPIAMPRRPRPSKKPSAQPKRRTAKRPKAPPAQPRGERLQKVLAGAGFGSRRKCEELITAGRVEVDREVVTELGVRVDPGKQQIRVDGQAIKKVRRTTYAVNKPQGVVSTNRDPAGRPRVIDLVPQSQARLFAIGRLDLNSEGLILVTNDGELANRLTHPRYEVPKTYRVQVAGRPEREVLAQLRRGVRLAEGIARADRVQIKSRHKESTMLEMVLREGRNREIRRVLAKVGHKVLRLVRVAVGPVRLGRLPPGESRPLRSDELRALRRAAGLDRG